MTFEDTLRDRLEHEARSVPLPVRAPGRAVARARARHRHRMVVTGVAATAAVSLAAVTLVTRQGARPHDSVATPASPPTLPNTGPLNLDWRPAKGGLSLPDSASQTADGTVYAVSTGPGVRYGSRVPLALSLYRLGADGTWQPTPLGGARPRLDMVATAGGVLYGMSTAPAADGGNARPQVSASGDGGRTWTADQLPLADPPAGARHLTRWGSAAIAGNGSQVIAVVSTHFAVDSKAIFPELAGGRRYRVEQRDEGLVLTKARGGAVYTPAPAPAGQAPAADGGPGDLVVDTRGAARDDVRTVPWSELGLHGKADLDPANQVFTPSGGSWRQVSATPANLEGLNITQVGTVGDRFLAEGYGADHALVSDDGEHWTPVPAPPGSALVGTGSALVSYPKAGTTLRVSADAGASWTEVDLAAAGAAGGSHVLSASGGPLGVSLMLADGANHPTHVATSSNLTDWAVTPVSDIAGPGAYVSGWTFVGADQIVVGAEKAPGGNDAETITAVGTPVRG